MVEHTVELFTYTSHIQLKAAAVSLSSTDSTEMEIKGRMLLCIYLIYLFNLGATNNSHRDINFF